MSSGVAAELVANYIRDAIVDGQIAAGDRIDLAWLADELNVSRTPVREALLRLESEGLLESLPSRATIVRRMSMRRVEELFAARIALEGTLAAVGAAQIEAAGLDALAELLDAIVARDDHDRRVELVALHARFLLVLYEAARSDRLLQMARPLVIQGCTLVRHFSYADRDHIRQSGHEPYIGMLSACRAHDGTRCEQLIRSLLVSTAAEILALERLPDELEYLPSVLRPAEMRAYRATFSSRGWRPRRMT